MIQIDKNIPLPPRAPRGRKSGKPSEGISRALRSMEIGDSFVVGMDHNHLTAWVYGWAKRQAVPLGFAVRDMPDGTRRVWRIA